MFLDSRVGFPYNKSLDRVVPRKVENSMHYNWLYYVLPERTLEKSSPRVGEDSK